MAEPPTDLHSLLRSQLLGVGVDGVDQAPTAAQFQALLKQVSKAYATADGERSRLERSLRVSGEQMQHLYDDLRERSESRIAQEAQKLRAIVDSIGDGLCVVDEQGRVEFANGLAAELIDQRDDELEGLRVLDQLQLHGAPDRRECLGNGPLLALLDTCADLRCDEAHLHRAHAAPLAISFVLTPMMRDDRLQGAVLVFRDRTEALQQRAELIAAHDRAAAASRAKSGFLATMSHEIRTPLNGVLGVMQLLLRTELDNRQREYAETVVSSGNSLLTILGDILDFSKIEAGKLELEHIEFDLDHAVDEVVTLFRDTARAKGIRLECEVDERAPRHVLGDPGRLRQVIMNLVANALKFTAEGFVRIRVAPEPSNQRLRIEVRDSGEGIPEDRLDRLFQAFSQTDASTTRRFGGTGLGLAICRSLVQAMGGTIRAESVVGDGSTFTFTVALPAVEHEAQEPVPAIVLPGADPEQTGLLRRLSRAGAGALEARDLDHAERLLSGLAGRRALVVGPDDEAHREVIRGWRRQDGHDDLRALLTDAPGAAHDCDCRDGICHLALPTSVGSIDRHLQQLWSADSDDPTRRAPEQQDAVSLRVLVVEDNAVNQMVACRMLEHLGHTVGVAANGIEAIAQLANGAFQLILMDCQMPEMDGYEASRRIRLDEAPDEHVPIIALTANAMKGEREQCLLAGMDDYLSKPLRMQELEAALLRWQEQALAAAPPALATRRTVS